MPMIEVTTTQSITKEIAEKIKKGLGENITIFPDKNESRVMVVIKGDTPIYFGGKEGPAALISIALFKPQPENTYDLYSKVAIDTIINAIPEVQRDRVYVKYQTLEFKAWGKDI